MKNCQVQLIQTNRVLTFCNISIALFSDISQNFSLNFELETENDFNRMFLHNSQVHTRGENIDSIFARHIFTLNVFLYDSVTFIFSFKVWAVYVFHRHVHSVCVCCLADKVFDKNG